MQTLSLFYILYQLYHIVQIFMFFIIIFLKCGVSFDLSHVSPVLRLSTAVPMGVWDLEPRPPRARLGSLRAAPKPRGRLGNVHIASAPGRGPC